jgi:predicted nucleic acid-binding protein
MASTQTSKLSKAFIDSSVLMAAAISPTGAGRELLNQGFVGQVDLSISTDVLQETERNLQLKAPRALPDFYRFRNALAGKLVQPTRTQILRAARVVEAKDAPIVAAALRAWADYLATYDRRHLLSQRDKIKARFGIAVVLPDEILAMLRQQQGGTP